MGVLAMNRISAARLLRFRHGITTVELARAAGVSHQYISSLELGKYCGGYDYRKSGGVLMQRAFEIVAAERNARARYLSEDFDKYRYRLLDFLEGDYEL
jgi:hypothetical protein